MDKTVDLPATFTAFVGDRLLVTGEVETMLLAAKQHLDQSGSREPLVVFEDESGQPIDFDLRGSPAEVLARLSSHPHLIGGRAPAKRSGPGRPRL